MRKNKAPIVLSCGIFLMITFLPPLAAAGLGIDNRPILTSPYPLWLTAAQTGSLAVVLLLASGIAGRHATSAWKRWRGGEITLGEDASGSRDKRKPPKNLKEAQDREIWENVRGMMPERDEPIGLELFWRRVSLVMSSTSVSRLCIGCSASCWPAPCFPSRLSYHVRPRRTS